MQDVLLVCGRQAVEIEVLRTALADAEDALAQERASRAMMEQEIARLQSLAAE